MFCGVNIFRNVLVWGVFSFFMMPAVSVVASDSQSLTQTVNVFSANDRQSSLEREKLFQLALDEQTRLLEKSKQRLKHAEREQQRLKDQFDANEAQLAELENKLQQRTGALGEVFGVAKESALELVPMLRDSVTSADYPDRQTELAFADSKRIPGLSDLQALWQQFRQEVIATGQVKTFEAPVVMANGQEQTLQVFRAGVFSVATSAGDYLAWDVGQQKLVTLGTQPPSSAGDEIRAFVSKKPATLLLDPSRGELFALLDRVPDIVERVKQGGNVGYFIISLGVLGILVALWQLIRLLITEIGVRKQLKEAHSPRNSNPLGRVLIAVNSLEQKGLAEDKAEEIELKVDEAILHEIPRIEHGQSFLKLLAAVAPLLGLLGTVIGMIATFQSITLFGTSDPKLMASGISQALMTTVLGLVVAVPVLFCHSLLATRGRRLIQILQAKSLAALAGANTAANPA